MVKMAVLFFYTILAAVWVSCSLIKRKLDKTLTKKLTAGEAVQLAAAKSNTALDDISIMYDSKNYSYNYRLHTVYLKKDVLSGSDLVGALHEFSHAVHSVRSDGELLRVLVNTRVLSWIASAASVISIFVCTDHQMTGRILLISLIITSIHLVTTGIFERTANSILLKCILPDAGSIVKVYIVLTEISQILGRGVVPLLLAALLLAVF